MGRSAATVLMALGVVVTAPAQSDTAFRREQAAVLHRCAAAAQKAGFPSAARPIFIEILAAYDPDDARARSALGYVRAGAQWMRSESPSAGTIDALDNQAARKVLAVWRRAADDLAAAHRVRGSELATGAHRLEAHAHFRRALRFRPGDPKVREALAELNGGPGTERSLEARILDRTSWIRSRVREELRTDYQISDAPERTPPGYVSAAGIETICVESEHFVLFGTHDSEVLREAARNAERIWSLWPEIAPELVVPQSTRRLFVLLDDGEDFDRILRTTPELVPDERRREFLIEHTSAATLGTRAERARVDVADTPEGVYDSVVRTVATTMSDVDSDVVIEGVAHTAVGWMFGRSLAYYLDLSRARTTTGSQPEFLPPDMGAWPELVVEAAAGGATRPLAELALAEYSRFSAADRAAAWSLTDYLLRRDPALLAAYDDAASRPTVARFIVTFEKHLGLAIEVVEADWRSSCVDEWGAATWNRDGARLLGCASREAERWLRDFVSARRAVLDADLHGTPEVAWSASRALACSEHVLYLAANSGERGSSREQTQDLLLPGSSVRGAELARHALVGIGRRPDRVLADWIHLPGYRDALLNPHLEIVGLSAEDGVAVFDVRTEPAEEDDRQHDMWPRRGASGIPKSIRVTMLGEQLQLELARQGHGRARAVGYPLSYHSWDEGYEWDDTRCIVEQRGHRLPGILLRETGVRRGHVPGLLVFVPFEPFRTGEVEVRFEQDFDEDGEFEVLYDATFTTR